MSNYRVKRNKGKIDRVKQFNKEYKHYLIGQFNLKKLELKSTNKFGLMYHLVGISDLGVGFSIQIDGTSLVCFDKAGVLRESYKTSIERYLGYSNKNENITMKFNENIFGTDTKTLKKFTNKTIRTLKKQAKYKNNVSNMLFGCTRCGKRKQEVKGLCRSCYNAKYYKEQKRKEIEKNNVPLGLKKNILCPKLNEKISDIKKGFAEFGKVLIKTPLKNLSNPKVEDGIKTDYEKALEYFDSQIRSILGVPEQVEQVEQVEQSEITKLTKLISRQNALILGMQKKIDRLEKIVVNSNLINKRLASKE